MTPYGTHGAADWVRGLRPTGKPSSQLFRPLTPSWRSAVAEICCDTCPFEPTCEEIRDFERDVLGLGEEWGQEHDDA